MAIIVTILVNKLDVADLMNSNDIIFELSVN